MSFLHIEPERVEAVWVSSAEGPRFAQEMTGFIQQIQSLGPLVRETRRERVGRTRIKPKGSEGVALVHGEP